VIVTPCHSNSIQLPLPADRRTSELQRFFSEIRRHYSLVHNLPATGWSLRVDRAQGLGMPAALPRDCLETKEGTRRVDPTPVIRTFSAVKDGYAGTIRTLTLNIDSSPTIQGDRRRPRLSRHGGLRRDRRRLEEAPQVKPPMNSNQLPESTTHKQSRVPSQDPRSTHACSSRRILGLAPSREAR
jgi:hypothetical protein